MIGDDKKIATHRENWYALYVCIEREDLKVEDVIREFTELKCKRRGKVKRSNYSEEQISAVLNYKMKGISVKVIAQNVGLNKKDIYNIHTILKYRNQL